MRCIQCGSLKDKVLDSRSSKDGTAIRRRRECLRCGYRYTTYEHGVAGVEARWIARGAQPREAHERIGQGLREAAGVDGPSRPRGGGDSSGTAQGSPERGAVGDHWGQGDGQAASD